MPYVLGIHDHKNYVDVYGFDSKSRHKKITTINGHVSYDNPQTESESIFLLNQTIIIYDTINVKNKIMSWE